MNHNFPDLKIECDLPGGVTLAKSNVGEIVAIDAEGKRRTLDNDDSILWFFQSVTDTFPSAPRIPAMSPETAETIRRSQERRAAKTSGSPLTGYKDADGNMVIALEDGTTVKLPSA